MTQRYRLLQALRDAGDTGLSSWDAGPELGILRLSGRLKDLREEGFQIDTVRLPNAPDGTARFRYFLRAEPEQRQAPPAVEPTPSFDQLFHTPTPRKSAVTGRDVQEEAA